MARPITYTQYTLSCTLLTPAEMNYCHAPAGLHHQCAFGASVTCIDIDGNQAMINNWHEIGSTIHVTPLSFSFLVVRFQTLWILNKLTRHGVFLLEVSCDGSIRFDPVETGRYRNSWLDHIHVHVNIFYALFWTDFPSKKVFHAHIATLSPVFNIDITVDHMIRYYLSTFSFGLT